MDFYVLLGIGRQATPADVRRAYRRLARRYHPDINPGDARAAEMFRVIQEAYETLADEERRRRYDVMGGVAIPPEVESRFEFSGFDFAHEAQGRAAATFSELFADAISGAAPATSSERGADLHVTMTLAFEEAAQGGRRTVPVTRLERCAPCRGHGFLPGPESACVYCDGTGHVRGARGHMVFTRVCSACGGRGVVRYRPCPACGAEGVGVHSDAVDVELPPGLDSGALVSLPGQGHAGRRGGPPGDLRLTIAVRPHRFYRREGDDVHLEVPVAVHEAALGTRIEVPTLDGPARMRIPPGTQSGQTFRLRERGVPSPRDGRRGDLVVTVRIVLPRVMDERSKELLREFGRLNPDNLREELGV